VIKTQSFKDTETRSFCVFFYNFNFFEKLLFLQKSLYLVQAQRSLPSAISHQHSEVESEVNKSLTLEKLLTIIKTP